MSLKRNQKKNARISSSPGNRKKGKKVAKRPEPTTPDIKVPVRKVRPYPDCDLHYDTVRRNPDQSEGWMAYLGLDRAQKYAFLWSIRDTSQTVVNMFQAMDMFQRYGQQVVMVGPNTQRLFAKTPCPRIPSAKIPLPFPGFYLAFPDSTLKVWGGERTGWHSLRGVYVRHHPVNPVLGIEVPETCLYLWAAPNEKSLTLGDDACLWVKYTWADEYLEDQIATQMASLSEDGREYFESFDLAEDGSTPPRFEGVGEAVSEVNTRTAIAVARMVVNTCLYMAAHEADASPTFYEGVRSEALVTRYHPLLERTDKKAKALRKTIWRDICQSTSARITVIGEKLEQAVPSLRGGSATERIERRAYWVGLHGRWQVYGRMKDDEGNHIPAEDRPHKFIIIYPYPVAGRQA
jgi:hypothetical protein